MFYQHYAHGLVIAASLLCLPFATHSEPVDLMLATGHLGAGAFGLFDFTVELDVGAGDALQIGTAGSNFDTEIAIYDTQGRLVATNDDITPFNKLSQLTFGANKVLAAGNYTAVLSGFNTIFRDGNISSGSSREGDFQLNIQSTQPVRLPQIPSQLALDGRILPSSIKETELGQGWLDAFSVQRIDFVLQDDIFGGDWLAIHTYGSELDTEVGLYDAQGKLIATNDDIDSRNKLSRLSFGLDGDNGRNLLAGAYTLLLGGFNTIFRDDLVAKSSLQQGGDYSVYVQSSGRILMTTLATPVLDVHTVPEPSTLILTIVGFLMLKRRR